MAARSGPKKTGRGGGKEKAKGEPWEPVGEPVVDPFTQGSGICNNQQETSTHALRARVGLEIKGGLGQSAPLSRRNAAPHGAVGHGRKICRT